MINISWSKVVIICTVMLIVLKPNDLLKVMYMFGQLIRRVRRMTEGFQNNLNEILDQTELDELRRQINLDITKVNNNSKTTDNTLQINSSTDQSLPASLSSDEQSLVSVDNDTSPLDI
ncbi:MAG: hypothetical protein LBS66_03665 [Rhodospirillaceae bacterium]|nr:hypothetical protein [Rhodospirillaceae bacterium]